MFYRCDTVFGIPAMKCDKKKKKKNSQIIYLIQFIEKRVDGNIFNLCNNQTGISYFSK